MLDEAKFSDDLGNVLAQRYEVELSKYKNFAYVLGDDEDGKRWDQVYDEISRVAYLKWRVDFLMRGGRLRKEGVSLNGEDLSLYFELTSGSRFLPVIGKGEAAGIVLAKKHDGILASNNLRDVKRYVRKFGL